MDSIYDLIDRIPYNFAVGLALLLFGAAMMAAPGFAFQGDLLAVSVVATQIYAAWFVVSGIVLLYRRPREFGFVLLSAPLVFHLTINVVDIVQALNVALLPIAVLYSLLLYLLYKMYRMAAHDDT